MTSTTRRARLVTASGGCLALLLAWAPLAAQPMPDIQRADVERIVSTLASDEMRGREAFSDDALRAADFIAREFAQAGLEPFDGADGHLQRFGVLAYSMAPARVTVNGQPLSPDRYQVRYGVPSIDWSTGDTVSSPSAGTPDRYATPPRGSTAASAQPSSPATASHRCNVTFSPLSAPTATASTATSASRCGIGVNTPVIAGRTASSSRPANCSRTRSTVAGSIAQTFTRTS